MSEEIKPFRIAIRQEGAWVNGYLAPIGSMKSAALLASAHARFLEDHPKAWDAFKEFLTLCATEFCARSFGAMPKRVEYEDAPEHEKAGHG